MESGSIVRTSRQAAYVLLIAAVGSVLAQSAFAVQSEGLNRGSGVVVDTTLVRFSENAPVNAPLTLLSRGEATRVMVDPGPCAGNSAEPGETEVGGLPAGGAGGDLVDAGTTTTNLGAFSINIIAGPALSANLPALAAFNRAAQQWEARIADPIAVNINADMATLPSNIIGQAGSVRLQGGYDEVRDAMVADATDEADDAIVGALPTAAQFIVELPVAIRISPAISPLNGNVVASKANFKALGFPDLDARFGATDAVITFNSQFSFDYDSSDGVPASKMDFETVAAHEIGHALGFLSAVDVVDVLLDQGKTTNQLSPMTLDLFRFDNDGASDPSNPPEFTTMPRSMVPANDEITDQILPWGILSDLEFRMSTGANMGDGLQASHWKNNAFGADPIGVMDPQLRGGTITPVNESDLRAMDLIGYEIVPIPEPGTLALLAVGALCLAVFCRRRR